jgi:hypothetical protein
MAGSVSAAVSRARVSGTKSSAAKPQEVEKRLQMRPKMYSDESSETDAHYRGRDHLSQSWPRQEPKDFCADNMVRRTTEGRDIGDKGYAAERFHAEAKVYATEGMTDKQRAFDAETFIAQQRAAKRPTSRAFGDVGTRLNETGFTI